jgi:hypothetical protein
MVVVFLFETLWTPISYGFGFCSSEVGRRV